MVSGKPWRFCLFKNTLFLIFVYFDFKCKVYAWGDNDHGQQGNGTTTVNRRPQMVLGLEEFKITRVACGSSHSIAWAESDFPPPTTHEPVMFPASRDPLGASSLSSDFQVRSISAEAQSNEYAEQRHRPSLAKIVLSLNSNHERQQALGHILGALQIIYSRDAVVRALMAPHSFSRSECTPEAQDDEVASLASASYVSIDDVKLMEGVNKSRKTPVGGIDDFTINLAHDDARLLVELLKLAVADRAGENGKEVLSEVLRALAETKPEVSLKHSECQIWCFGWHTRAILTIRVNQRSSTNHSSV